MSRGLIEQAGLFTEKGENRYENLMEQVKTVFKNAINDSNVRTDQKYYSAMSTFTRYISEFEGTGKMQNVSIGQVFGFVNIMKDLGMKDETLKPYMAGIKDFYQNLKGMGCKVRTIVPSNSELGIDPRVNGSVEKAWSAEEINSAKDIAIATGRLDIYHSINISSSFGTRLDGSCTLTIAQINDALKTGSLHVVEKGGNPRDIPLTPQGRQVLVEAKEWAASKANWKDHIFCPNSDIGAVKQSVQDWIYNHRDSFQDKDRVPSWEARANFKDTGNIQKGDLTFHGLRHQWARETYNNFLNKGYSETQALKSTSVLLGHSRIEVTIWYLAHS